MNDGLHREVIGVTRNNDRLLSDGRTSGVVYYGHDSPRQMTDISRQSETIIAHCETFFDRRRSLVAFCARFSKEFHIRHFIRDSTDS
jgi:hypothetical protein